jgi:hypothetical protein
LGGGVREGAVTQILYAHMNKILKNKKIKTKTVCGNIFQPSELIHMITQVSCFTLHLWFSSTVEHFNCCDLFSHSFQVIISVDSLILLFLKKAPTGRTFKLHKNLDLFLTLLPYHS